MKSLRILRYGMSETQQKELCVGIIMDGNRRFARAKGKQAFEGHREGARALEKLLESYHALRERYGLAHYVFYAFSTENWNRDEREVSALMSLLLEWLSELKEKINTEENTPGIRFIGDRARFEESIREAMEEIEEHTKSGDGTIALALSYGGRDEITRAVRALTPPITEDSISKALDTAGIPDPDLVIRTGGEKRLSNFLLWQSAYSELFFCDVLWPEFTVSHLEKIMEAFAKRSRRIGV